MTTVSYDSPDEDVALDALTDGLRNGDTVLLCVTCEVEYDGRAAGYLGPGDRVIICKPDGTTLVHRTTGHDPVNWQPPGSSVTASMNENLEITSRRSSPAETLTLMIHEVYHLVRFAAEDSASLELEGTEMDMHEYVISNPEEIEEGLRINEHERDTPYGSIDMFGHDREGNPVVVEVKRRKATLKHVDQLKRYTDLYRESNANTRGILVAPDASAKVKRTLQDNELEFAKIDAFAPVERGHSSTTLADFDQ